MEEKMMIDYDQENDDLFISKNEKVKGSVNIGDFIVDFTSSGKVAGLEIMNASSILSKINNLKMSRSILSNIKRVNLRAEYRNNGIYILAMIFVEIQREERPITASILLPQMISA